MKRRHAMKILVNGLVHGKLPYRRVKDTWRKMMRTLTTDDKCRAILRVVKSERNK